MNTKSATQMATLYGMKSSVAFNKLLARCGILKVSARGGYVLEESLRQLGLMAVVEVPFFLPNGIRAKKEKAVWNEKGQEYVHNRLARLGILPVSEQTDLFGMYDHA